MKYPNLIKKSVCTQPVTVEIKREGRNMYGEPLEPIVWEGTCNYQDGASTVYNDQKEVVQISGRAYIPGDIAPEIPVIRAGKITVHGAERELYQGIKARNPDGTVNYTRLDVK